MTMIQHMFQHEEIRSNRTTFTEQNAPTQPCTSGETPPRLVPHVSRLTPSLMLAPVHRMIEAGSVTITTVQARGTQHAQAQVRNTRGRGAGRGRARRGDDNDLAHEKANSKHATITQQQHRRMSPLSHAHRGERRPHPPRPPHSLHPCTAWLRQISYHRHGPSAG